MTITGNIKLINETQTFDSGFTKRELVLTTNDMYPQDILIEFIKDNCETLNNYKVGQDVTIDFNLRGREWVSPKGETKYFNTIQGWRIDGATEQNHVEPVSEDKDEDLLPF